MGFADRVATDLDGFFEEISSTEGTIFSQSVTLRKEDGTESTIQVIQTDYYNEFSDQQHRIFRVRSSQGPIVRGDIIIQVIDTITRHWTVRDVKNDELGLLNVRCTTPIGKG